MWSSTPKRVPLISAVSAGHSLLKKNRAYSIKHAVHINCLRGPPFVFVPPPLQALNFPTVEGKQITDAQLFWGYKSKQQCRHMLNSVRGRNLLAAHTRGNLHLLQHFHFSHCDRWAGSKSTISMCHRFIYTDYLYVAHFQCLFVLESIPVVVHWDILKHIFSRLYLAGLHCRTQ